MDPLAQLHDIQTPEQIGQFPLAIGWYILIAMILLLIVLAVRHLFKIKALKQDQQVALASVSKAKSNQEVISIVKWAAMSYFPRNEIASLHGESLKHFLSKTLPEKKQAQFTLLADTHFDNLYQADSAQELSLAHAAKYWLLHALPVKGVANV